MLSQIRLKIAEKLKDRDYRHKFFRGRAEDEVATQLLEFRKKRGLTQQDLAEKCGMKQSAISRIEKSSYSKWNFSTLWRLAQALDVRIRVVVDDMRDVVREYEVREKRATVHSDKLIGASTNDFPERLEAITAGFLAGSTSSQAVQYRNLQ
ncbi:MAG TPA: helix-turn-helix transcriptional regulator [Candidatus Acidoferrales bacterium]